MTPGNGDIYVSIQFFSYVFKINLVTFAFITMDTKLLE